MRGLFHVPSPFSRPLHCFGVDEARKFHHTYHVKPQVHQLKVQFLDHYFNITVVYFISLENQFLDKHLLLVKANKVDTKVKVGETRSAYLVDH